MGHIILPDGTIRAAANPFEFKTIGQNVYFRPNSNCQWMLFATAFDENDAKKICEALQFSDIDFSITYQFHADTISPK
jgi:hypothetical protein